MRRAVKLALEFTTLSFAGWVVENVAQGPEDLRYSNVFGGRRVPLLPVWGVGGLATMQLAKRLKRAKVPVVYRALAYGLSAAAIEYVACHADRWVGFKSWDYTGDPTADRDGCVDLKHTVAWSLLALAAEPFVA